MKNLNLLSCALCLMMLSMAIISCAGKKDNVSAQEENATENVEEAVSKDGIEYTSAFICPMHCKGSGSAESGECPVCGMDYIANDNFKAVNSGGTNGNDGHDHDHNHDHGDHEGHEH